jgi:uncharacterized protein YjdB
MKTHTTFLLAAALAIVSLLAASVSCGGENSPSVPVVSVKITPPKDDMHEGETMPLPVEIRPENATNKTLSWTSSRPDVASVVIAGPVGTGATVTAHKAGEASIWAVSRDSGAISNICNIRVGPSIDSISISVDSGFLPLTPSGLPVTLRATIVPATAVNQTVTWSSYNTAVATVRQHEDDGLLCDVLPQQTPGSATIVVMTQDRSRMAQMDIVVAPGTSEPVDRVELDKDSVAMGMWCVETLNATVFGEGDAPIADQRVAWASDVPGVVAVTGSSGSGSTATITPVAPGAATITVTSAADPAMTAECRVTVAGVYATGYQYSQGVSIAKLWESEGGDGRSLSAGGAQARVNSVFAAGSVVYAAGFENGQGGDARPRATLWSRDGSQSDYRPHSLGDPGNASAVNSVYVPDLDGVPGNVYAAGYENDGDTPVARLWIDGGQVGLFGGGRNAEAKSVYASPDGLYYVAGFQMDEPAGGLGRPRACLWTNGYQRFLSDVGEPGGDRSAEAASVYVADDVAYVAGFEKNDEGRTVAKLWIIDGASVFAVTLSNGLSDARANAVFAVGDAYYVAGHEYDDGGKSRARLWARAEGLAPSQGLSDGAANADARAVFALGGGVYVAGAENNYYGRPTGRLWLLDAGRPVQTRTLGNGTDNSAALSVFLK